jgi:hypothetical protein
MHIKSLFIYRERIGFIINWFVQEVGQRKNIPPPSMKYLSEWVVRHYLILSLHDY